MSIAWLVGCSFARPTRTVSDPPLVRVGFAESRARRKDNIRPAKRKLGVLPSPRRIFVEFAFELRSRSLDVEIVHGLPVAELRRRRGTIQKKENSPCGNLGTSCDVDDRVRIALPSTARRMPR